MKSRGQQLDYDVILSNTGVSIVDSQDELDGIVILVSFAGLEEANAVKKQMDYPYTAVAIIEV